MPSSVLVRVVFGVLVLATFGAFIVAQRLKRSSPIVDQVYYPRYIGPKCGCEKARVRFFFAPRVAGHVTAQIVDAAGDPVRTLVNGRELSRRRHHFTWNGRTDAGLIAPDGKYHLRVTLEDQGRSVTLPQAITLDTRPPHPRVLSVTPAVIVPGAPGKEGRARIRFHGSANPRPLVQVFRTDLPKPQLLATFEIHRGRHTGTWDGLVNGRPAPDGIYDVTVTTHDRAGNAGHSPRRLPPTASEAVPHSGVSVRYLTVSGPLVPVRAGSPATFSVGPLPRRLRWSLGPVGSGKPLARGGGRAPRLVVRVPRGTHTGLYLLRVQAGGHRAAQPVAVQGPGRGRVLVVLPAMTWQGTNQVDDDGDGFANTLSSGNDVNAARAFAHGQPPAGLVDGVEPLLRLLDRERAPYEITTDLALAQRGGAGIAGHSGVLFAGSETWLTSKVDLALRSYVEQGGKVASFGTDAFRRLVRVEANLLTGPTPPERVNVFGEETALTRIAEAPMVVNQPDTLGLFTGTDGLVGLFTQFEQSRTLVNGAQILSSAGRDPQHPSFVAYRLGKGTVVRVGSPAWSADLAGNTELTDVTRRIWSLLSR
ncbi:MAG TPA: N,N-dimethylformamidase beta subunit family domain-containing protein [Thermoleophilaceae bacterium]|nr:N,N-dimethylformamidase beta subunit family domain-containing protein [Thermoleophilaceae bacterium]